MIILHWILQTRARREERKFLNCIGRFADYLLVERLVLALLVWRVWLETAFGLELPSHTSHQWMRRPCLSNLMVVAALDSLPSVDAAWLPFIVVVCSWFRTKIISIKLSVPPGFHRSIHPGRDAFPFLLRPRRVIVVICEQRVITRPSGFGLLNPTCPLTWALNRSRCCNLRPRPSIPISRLCV